MSALLRQTSTEVDLDRDPADVSSDDGIVSAWYLLALSIAAEVVEHHATVHSHEIVGSVCQVHKLCRIVTDAGVGIRVFKLRVRLIELAYLFGVLVVAVLLGAPTPQLHLPALNRLGKSY